VAAEEVERGSAMGGGIGGGGAETGGGKSRAGAVRVVSTG
jgi:hypothetical protein